MMISKLDKDIKTFNASETIAAALDYLRATLLSHVFIVVDHQFVGSLSKEDLELVDPSSILEEALPYSTCEAVLTDKHWLHIMELFSTCEANVIASVDQNNVYQGAYCLEDFSTAMLDLSMIQDSGYVMVLRSTSADQLYSLVVNTIAAHGGRIMGMITTDVDEFGTELTLKIANYNTDKILEFIVRNGIEVVYSDTMDPWKQSMNDNADYLNTFLNI